MVIDLNETLIALITYWEENEDHAVVVVGLDNANSYLNDPGKDDSSIKVSRGDFELAGLERDEIYAAITRKQ